MDMSNKKDFNYEMNEPVITNMPTLDNWDNYEVTDVIFLTPAKVVGKHNDRLLEEVLHVDLMNKKAYTKDGKLCPYSDKIFHYLDHSTAVPDDFFASPPDNYQETFEEYFKLRDEYQPKGD
jgi:hypothetical protein